MIVKAKKIVQGSYDKNKVQLWEPKFSYWNCDEQN